MGVTNVMFSLVKVAQKLKEMDNNNVKNLLTKNGLTELELESYCIDYDLKDVIFTRGISK